ncbi:hypothetical protein B566_EDAN010838, partial [Ephemera danica]
VEKSIQPVEKVSIVEIVEKSIQPVEKVSIAEIVEKSIQPVEKVSIAEIVEKSIQPEPVENRMDCLPQNDVASPLKLSECRVLVPKLLECDSCKFYTDKESQLATHVQAHQATNAPVETMCKCRPSTKGLNASMIVAPCGQCGLIWERPEVPTENVASLKHTDQVDVMKNIPTSAKDFETETQMQSEQESSNFPIAAKCKKTFDLRENHNSNSQAKKDTTLCRCRPSNESLDDSMIGLLCDHCGLICEMPTETDVIVAPENSVVPSSFMHRGAISRRKTSRVAKSKKDFKNQLQNNHENKNVPNGAKFNKMENLINDVRNREFLKCLHCNKAFLSFPKLQNHSQDEHPGKFILQCDICNFQCSSSEALVRHKANKHATPPRLYTCNFCAANYFLPEKLALHIRKEHNSSVPCNICSETFKCAADFYVHRSRDHSSLRHYCHHCKYSADRRHNLDRHIRQKHSLSVSINTLTCMYCDKPFKCESYVRRHVYDVHLGPVLRCHFCKYDTRSKNCLI